MNNAIAASYAAIVQQVLSSFARTPTSAPPASPAEGGGIILKLTPTPSPPDMDLTLNQLLNTSLPLSSVKPLPPELLKPQVLEALVLRSQLLAPPKSDAGQPAPPLPNTPPATSSPTAPAGQYRVSVEWQGRALQLLSPQPLPVGSRVQIEIDQRGELRLLPPRLNIPSTPPTAGERPQPTSVQPPLPAPLQQAVRESLPRQQPLQTLLPTLLKLAAPALLQRLPAPVAQALQQVVKALPTPTQLQQPEGLRRAVVDSGSFLEAKLAAAVLSPAARPGAPTGDAVEPIPAALDRDLKAQLAKLLAVVRQAGFTAPQRPTTTIPDTLVYAAKPLLAPNLPQAQAATADEADTLLLQLDKLLQAGLARIQLNQLDAAISRHPAGNDAAPPAPAWVLELPLPTPRGHDQLQLRFERRQQRRDGRVQMQWQVQLAFDLHELGKLAVNLNIVEQSVAAILWAEREHTHRAVRQEMDFLRAGLESVGVRVTELQCRLGLPPERGPLAGQSLVDIHT